MNLIRLSHETLLYAESEYRILLRRMVANNTINPESSNYTPEEFKQLLEHSFPFPDTFQVTGSLDLSNSDKEFTLPATLLVDGDLNLSCCTKLKTLPEKLTVNGHLDLTGCTSLDAKWVESIAKMKHDSAGKIYTVTLPGIDFLQPLMDHLGSNHNLAVKILLPEEYSREQSNESDELSSHSSSYESAESSASEGDNSSSSSDYDTRQRSSSNSVGSSYEDDDSSSSSDSENLIKFDCLDCALDFWFEKMPDQEVVQLDFLNESACYDIKIFLERLTQTREYEHEEVLAKRVVDVLSTLEQNEAIRSRAITLISQGISSCTDRVIATLDEVELLIHLDELEKAPQKEEELKQLGKSFLYLELIQAKARELARIIPDGDEVELNLALTLGLKTRFTLPIKTNKMMYYANLKEEEIILLGDSIEAACTDEKLASFLASWSPWKKHLRKQAIPQYDDLSLVSIESADSPCCITLEAPKQPVLYKGRVYEYSAFLTWYVEHGTDPCDRSTIDIAALQRPKPSTI